MTLPPAPPPDSDVLRPHTPLPAYYDDEADHQRYLRRIFDDPRGQRAAYRQVLWRQDAC